MERPLGAGSRKQSLHPATAPALPVQLWALDPRQTPQPSLPQTPDLQKLREVINDSTDFKPLNVGSVWSPTQDKPRWASVQK